MTNFNELPDLYLVRTKVNSLFSWLLISLFKRPSAKSTAARDVSWLPFILCENIEVYDQKKNRIYVKKHLGVEGSPKDNNRLEVRWKGDCPALWFFVDERFAIEIVANDPIQKQTHFYWCRQNFLTGQENNIFQFSISWKILTWLKRDGSTASYQYEILLSFKKLFLIIGAFFRFI